MRNEWLLWYAKWIFENDNYSLPYFIYIQFKYKAITVNSSLEYLNSYFVIANLKRYSHVVIISVWLTSAIWERKKITTEETNCLEL